MSLNRNLNCSTIEQNTQIDFKVVNNGNPDKEEIMSEDKAITWADVVRTSQAKIAESENKVKSNELKSDK